MDKANNTMMNSLFYNHSYCSYYLKDKYLFEFRLFELYVNYFILFFLWKVYLKFNRMCDVDGSFSLYLCTL
jgi:hypothetical protein